MEARRGTIAVLCAAAISLALAPWHATGQERSLDQYLRKLGLADLRLHHLERTLENTTAPEQQKREARRLADAYVEQMLAAADDAAKFESLQTRVQRLLASHPDANTAAVRVILLQADYQQAEAQLIRWLEDPVDKAALASAAETLARVAPALAAAYSELSAAADAELTRVETLPTDAARQAAEQEATRLTAIASRAAYFAAWSNYYLGVTRQNPALARAEFTAAKERFLGVLDVSDEMEYEGVEPGELALESLWRARAVVGLGLCELALGRLPAGDKVFGWLDNAAVPPVLRDQAGYWHVQGLLNVGNYTEAAALADKLVGQFAGSPSPGKNSLCIALIRVGAALDASQADLRRKLVEPGIRGLARMRQFDSLGQLMAKHKLDEVADRSSFYLTWLRGRQQFLAAEKTKSPDDFRAALATLEEAQAHPQAQADLTDAAQCRYYVAWCHYRLGDLDRAARGFQDAVTPLKVALPDLAVQSAWMHCVVLQQLVAKDKKHLPAALTALAAIKQDFPGSEQAAKAEFAIARLRQSHATPEESLAELSKVAPSDPNFAAAQYEICQLRYQLWNKAKADATKSAPLADALFKSVDRFLSAAAEADAQRRLKAALLAVDALSHIKPPDDKQIASYLKQVRSAAEHVDAGDPSAAEYHYRRLQLAQRAGDEATVRHAAEWIATNAAASRYALPALVVVAREADRAVEAASGADRTSRLQHARDTYAKLVELFGDSPDVLASNKNALASASKLAEYDEALGHWPEAADRLGKLLAAFPNDKQYLRRRGLALVQSGEHAQALDCWRKLIAGLAGGSDPWLEARYYQLKCLLATDRPAAEKVWRQFRLLFPEVKSPAWKDKFDELAKEFE